VGTGVDFSGQLALGVENALTGIGEATVFDSGRDEWWTVVFDMFIVAGDEVIMEEADDNC